MKASWQGHIALGQLGIPVRMYSAARSLRPAFTQLHEKDSAPVTRSLKCSAEDREISPKEIVRAVEYEPGRFITLTGQDLTRTLPIAAKTIEVSQFCNSEDIEPIYYEKPYYVVPAKGGERAYTLLRETLSRTKKVMITQFALQHKEHIGAVSIHRDLLVLHQLRFASEILPRSELKTRALPRPDPKEVSVLESVINHFSGPLHIEDYHDEYTKHIQALIERKAKGLPSARREPVAAGATPEDEIVSALKSTLSENPRQLSSSNANTT